MSLILCVTQIAWAMPGSADISGLKKYLTDRSRMPRVYIPDVVIVGKETVITVVANGASKVRLLGSFNANGIEAFDRDLGLRLGYEYHDWGEQQLKSGENQVKFQIPFYDQDAVGKNYFFEALVTYPDSHTETIEKAQVFGSNANYKAINAIAIAPEGDKGKNVGYDLKNTLFPKRGAFNY